MRPQLKSRPPAYALRRSRVVVGSVRAMQALDRGNATELLLTRRFIEMHPAHAAMAAQVAADRGVPTRALHGTAELELDLVGDGVGASVAPRQDAWQVR